MNKIGLSAHTTTDKVNSTGNRVTVVKISNLRLESIRFVTLNKKPSYRYDSRPYCLTADYR